MPSLTKQNQATFWANVAIGAPQDCWPWKRAKNPKTGYGQYGVTRRGKTIGLLAHRVAHCLGNLKSPHLEDVKLQVLHSCDVRDCCNPSHLWEGTHQDNMNDMEKKGRSNRIGLKSGRDYTQAIALIKAGRTLADISRELAIPHSTLRHLRDRIK